MNRITGPAWKRSYSPDGFKINWNVVKRYGLKGQMYFQVRPGKPDVIILVYDATPAGYVCLNVTGL